MATLVALLGLTALAAWQQERRRLRASLPAGTTRHRPMTGGRVTGVTRYILTGAPGSGKTSILRVLQKHGYAVVEEAATAVIATARAKGEDEPWMDPGFLERIVALQQRRQEESSQPGSGIQIYDRSPICTLALAHWLGDPVPTVLSEEIARITREKVYDRRVFFIRPLGFVEPTADRRISFEDSLAFERVHEETYVALGYEPVDVPPGTVEDRAARIDSHIRSWTSDRVKKQ
jgi:predicted ATPase